MLRPHSWRASEARYVGRNSVGNFPLDYAEVRGLVLDGVDREGAIRSFRADRLAAIASGETPVQLRPGARLVPHAIPFHAEAGTVDLTPVASSLPWPLPILSNDVTADRGRFNLEGYLAVGSGASGSDAIAYKQFFRNGSIEVVDTLLLSARDRHSGGLPARMLEAQLLAST
jgi:hypothetical protein